MMNDKLFNQCERVAASLIFRLGVHGIKAYIWHKATTGSIYIRFEDNRIGSIRIGDHDGRKKLKYKWNIRTDVPVGTAKWEKDGNVWRYYTHFHLWQELIPLLEKRAKDVKSWDKKYQYTIPYFKQDNA